MVALVLVAGFVLHLAYLLWRCPIDLSGDEAQYWDWSRQLQLSYYSKGPGIAHLIRASCSIFGDTMFGVRFPALVCSVLTMVCTWWITLRLFKSEKLALGAVLFCHIVWMFVAGSVLMTIDPPYYLCWAIATCLAVKALFDESRWAWPVIGVVVGVGFLFKYAMPLWLIGLFLFVLPSARYRKWLKTPWPWVMIVMMAICMSPVVIWNMQNDWIAFGHVARQTSENQSHFNPLNILGNYAGMVGSQIGSLNPFVAILMVAAVMNAISASVLDPDHYERRVKSFLLCMSLPFFACVMIIPIFKDVEPNWPAPTYFALVPLTVAFIASRWNNLADRKAWGWVLNAAIIAGVIAIPLIHNTALLYPITKHISPKSTWDPVRRLYGNEELGQIVSREIRAMGPDTMVIGEKYWQVGLLDFYVDGHPKAMYMGSWLADLDKRDRYCQYDLWPDRSLDRPELVGRNAVFVGYDTPDAVAAFERMEEVRDTKIVRNGAIPREWHVYRAFGFKGMKRPTDGKTPR